MLIRDLIYQSEGVVFSSLNFKYSTMKTYFHNIEFQYLMKKSWF